MKHDNYVEFSVFGNYGLFSDPIMRIGGEKFSYQIPTYEAVKGILHSVYWKPTLIWVVDEVRVMNQIQTETKGIRPIKYYNDKNDLSYYTYLRNCHYQVKAHFIWNENRPELVADQDENKHHNIAKRMIQRGGRRDIYLGCRECQGYVKPCIYGEGEGFYDHVEELSFGYMYHSITYADEAYSQETQGNMTINLWNATMRNGVIKYIPQQQCEHRVVKAMDIKPFGKECNNFTGIGEFMEVE